MKYNLGDEVEVSFIGKITSISLDLRGNKVYKVDSGDAYGAMAIMVPESNLYTLPMPQVNEDGGQDR